jgi:uncharacterized phage protein (TIGR01671 family)
MRQIKFRAWIEKKNENYNFSCGMHPWETIKNWVHLWEMVEEGLVILEQFTGLLDKYGKEIYEGDIARLGEWFDACGPAGYEKREVLVKWEDEDCGFHPFANYDCDCGVHHEADKCVVIGNKWENGDLLI